MLLLSTPAQRPTHRAQSRTSAPPLPVSATLRSQNPLEDLLADQEACSEDHLSLSLSIKLCRRRVTVAQLHLLCLGCGKDVSHVVCLQRRLPVRRL